MGRRYLLGQLIGEGGMGEVALCRDTKLGRDVAMKVMRSSVAKSAGEPRFLNEARVQARLEHPGIVPVYDVGRDEVGRAFFTMRRVQGSALDDIIARLASNDAATQQAFTRHRL